MVWSSGACPYQGVQCWQALHPLPLLCYYSWQVLPVHIISINQASRLLALQPPTFARTMTDVVCQPVSQPTNSLSLRMCEYPAPPRPAPPQNNAAAHFMRMMTEVVRHAHTLGICHRDIKPVWLWC